MRNELTDLRKFLIRLAWSAGGVVVVGFISLAYPSDRSIVEKIFYFGRSNLVPIGVKVVSFSPLDAFAAEISIALVIGFLCMFPVIMYLIAQYLFPALTDPERAAAKKVLVPGSILFIFGAVYSYLFVVPPTFTILYHFADRLGTEPLLTVPDLLSTVITLSFVSGMAFELPIIMFVLNRVGLVKRFVWAKYWRHFFFSCLAFFAVITPDGSGITMLILTIPMILLYCAGWGLSRRY